MSFHWLGRYDHRSSRLGEHFDRIYSFIIIDKNLKEYARGLSSFSSAEIFKIKGKHSNKIKDLLGYVAKSEVVHKDDMVEI